MLLCVIYSNISILTVKNRNLTNIQHFPPWAFRTLSYSCTIEGAQLLFLNPDPLPFPCPYLIFCKLGWVLQIHLLHLQRGVTGGEGQAAQGVSTSTPFLDYSHDFILDRGCQGYPCGANTHIGTPINDSFWGSLWAKAVKCSAWVNLLLLSSVSYSSFKGYYQLLIYIWTHTMYYLVIPCNIYLKNKTIFSNIVQSLH